MNRFLPAALVLVAVSALAYSNTFENGLHFDDLYRVENNPGVEQFWSPIRHFFDPSTSASLPRLRQYRPLLPLSLSINYAIAGHSVVAYHVGNLLIHVFASLALFLLARELFSHWTRPALPAYGALIVALLFAVHPVSGITVNYVCSRDLSMMQLFLLASLFCYVRMRRVGMTKKGWALCLGLLVCSLLAKKNAIVAPALVLLFEVLPARQSIGNVAVWRRVLPFGLVVVSVLAFARFVVGFSDLENIVAGDALKYAAAQSQHHVFHYLRNFIWPFPTRMAAADPLAAWKQGVGAMGILATLVLAWRVRIVDPLIAFCIVSYWTLLLMTSTVVPFHSDIVPYRPYPSSAFLFVLITALTLRRGRAGLIALLALGTWFATVSFSMNENWRDRETMYRHSIDYGATRMAYAGLADALPIGPEKERAYLDALHLDPSYSIAHVGLGFTQVALGKVPLGLESTRKAVQISPHAAQIRFLAGQVYHLAGLHELAADEAANSVELAANNAEYRHRAAWYAVDAGRYAKALELLRPLLDSNPDFERTRLFAGMALLGLRRPADAQRILEPYAAARPVDAQGWFFLGSARMSTNDCHAAIDAFSRALAADPGYRGAERARADCRRRLDNVEE